MENEARMRIALIGPAHPYKGGGARHTTELALRLAAAGHDVVIESWRAMYPAALYPGVQTAPAAEGEPYPRTRRLLSWRRPDGWLRAGRRLRDCDLAVFTFLAPVQVPAYLVIMRGMRHGSAAPAAVVICHNVLPHERRPGDIALTRALLHHATAVLTHTERLARAARDLAPGTPVQVADLPPHLPAVPARVADSPDPPPAPQAARDAAAVTAVPVRGADPPDAPPAPQAARHAAAVTAVPGEPGRAGQLPPAPASLHLLFFGIVRPYKGLDVLLRALALARPGSGLTLTLTVAGEFWGGLDATRALVSELGLDDRVELRPGYVPAGDIGALLRRADALVLPYRSATASQNAWLAFAHGVPVIATRTGTFCKQVSDGMDGLLCEPGDHASLAAVLAGFSKPGVAERLRRGVRPVEPDALWEAYLDALLAAAAPGTPPT